MSVKRILFVGMYPDEYSPYRNVFFQNLIFAMADKGIECTVISPVPVTRYRKHLREVSKKRIDKTPNGADVIVYHPRYISLSSKRVGKIHTGLYSEDLFQKCAIKTARKLEKNFDVVYGHFFLSGGLAAIKIGRDREIPSFIANGECDYNTEIVQQFRKLNRKDIEGLSGIIVVSTHNANVLKGKDIFKDIPMIVAPNAVDVSLFKKQDKYQARKALNLPQDTFIVGFVGGFIERKGDKRLLEAANRISDVYLAFAGKGEVKPSGERVLLCRAMKHEEVPVLLNAIDVFCLPTLNEGSCNAIVEAMACGCTIVSSNLPFNDDALTDENSIRIDPNSVDEIEKALKALFLNPDIRGKLSKTALLDSKKFEIGQRAKKILDFISDHALQKQK